MLINFLEQELLILKRLKILIKGKGSYFKIENFWESSRNSVTLQNLEDQLHINNLQLAEGQDPWELITSPTLDDEILGPIRSLIILKSFLWSNNRC